MQLEEKKVYQLDEFLFMLGFIPYFILSFLDTSTIHEVIKLNAYSQLCWNFALGIFIIKFLLDKFQLNEIFVYLIAVASIYVSYKTASSTVLYTTTILALLSRYVRSDVIAKLYFGIGIILFAIIIILAISGKIPNLTYSRNGFIRHAFGIVYTTDFASHVFYFICGYVFLRGKSYKVYDSIILIVIGLVLYLLTQARLNVLCVFLLILGRQLMNFDRNNLIKKFAWIVPSISFLSISLLSFFYQSEGKIFNIINKLLSNRLKIVHSAIGEYGVKLFGQRIIQNGWGGTGGLIKMKLPGFQYIYIDSAYMRLLLMFGLVTTVIVIGLISYQMFNIDNKYLLLILSIILISGTIEQHMFEIAYNPFFIILFAEWFREQLNRRSGINYEIS